MDTVISSSIAPNATTAPVKRTSMLSVMAEDYLRPAYFSAFKVAMSSERRSALMSSFGVITTRVLALLHMYAHSQVAVGAGSQLGRDYLATGKEKSIGSTIRRSMIISWVQGYIVCYAQCITQEFLVAEIVHRIEHGDLPPDVDKAVSDPRVLPILQAKFRTVSGYVFDPPNSEAVETWLMKYCEQHPANRITEAAAAFAGELEARSKTKP